MFKSLFHCLPALWHQWSLVSSELQTHDRKQSYLYSETDSTDTKRIRLYNEKRVRTGSVTLHSVCDLFCVWCDVCVRERNQCKTIECCSVGGHTLSFKLPSTASSPAPQNCLDEILREGDRGRREGGSGHTRNEIPDILYENQEKESRENRREKEKIDTNECKKKWEVWQILSSSSGNMTEWRETKWAEQRGGGEGKKETKWGHKNSLTGDR